MAYAPPDPKKVAAAQALHEAAQREIADIEARQKRIRAEILACYHPDGGVLNGVEYEGYSPPQIRHANRMIAKQHRAKMVGR